MHRIYASSRTCSLSIISFVNLGLSHLSIPQPQFKESLAYLTKYRVSLNSALSLVRSWVYQALEQCVQQAKQSADGAEGPITSPASESHAFTLLYGKFRLHADKMKHLMTDIELRREKGPE